MKKMGPEIFALDHLRWRSGSICGVSFQMEGISAVDICICICGHCNNAQVSTKRMDISPWQVRLHLVVASFYVLDFTTLYFAPSFRVRRKRNLQSWGSKFQGINTPTMSDRAFRSFNNRVAPLTPVRSVTTVSSSNSNWSFRSVASSSSTDSTSFWKTPPKKWKTSVCSFKCVSVPGLTFVEQQ
jgi:hypothetical protein